MSAFVGFGNVLAKDQIYNFHEIGMQITLPGECKVATRNRSWDDDLNSTFGFTNESLHDFMVENQFYLYAVNWNNDIQKHLYLIRFDDTVEQNNLLAGDEDVNEWVQKLHDLCENLQEENLSGTNSSSEFVAENGVVYAILECIIHSDDGIENKVFYATIDDGHIVILCYDNQNGYISSIDREYISKVIDSIVFDDVLAQSRNDVSNMNNDESDPKDDGEYSDNNVSIGEGLVYGVLNGVLYAVIFGGGWFLVLKLYQKYKGRKQKDEGKEPSIQVAPSFPSDVVETNVDNMQTMSLSELRDRTIPLSGNKFIVLENTKNSECIFRNELRDTLTMGREKINDICISDDKTIGRKHCVLYTKDDCVYVHDLGSVNTTVVNGNKISQDTLISNGDIIELGKTSFKVLLSDGTVKL